MLHNVRILLGREGLDGPTEAELDGEVGGVFWEGWRRTHGRSGLGRGLQRAQLGLVKAVGGEDAVELGGTARLTHLQQQCR